MLAKYWKKVLLAICVIAVLFNITYKIVHRIDISEELEAVKNGDIILFTTKEDEKNK